MYEFPPATDLQFLLGKAISHVSLDPYSIYFRLGTAQITSEDKIEYIDAAGVHRLYDCQTYRGQALHLQNLLEHRISLIESENLCLSLTFENGAILRIFSEIGRYECGHIGYENRLIIF